MTRLPRDVGSAQVIKVLERLGFVAAPSSGGSHRTYYKHVNGRRVQVTVVLGKKSITIGTLQNMIRQSGLSKEEFVKLLEDC